MDPTVQMFFSPSEKKKKKTAWRKKPEENISLKVLHDRDAEKTSKFYSSPFFFFFFFLRNYRPVTLLEEELSNPQPRFLNENEKFTNERKKRFDIRFVCVT